MDLISIRRVYPALLGVLNPSINGWPPYICSLIILHQRCKYLRANIFYLLWHLISVIIGSPIIHPLLEQIFSLRAMQLPPLILKDK